MTFPPFIPVFEPELSFLPFGCDACGERFSTPTDLDLHRRETCTHSSKPSARFGFGGEHWHGVADGGRRM